MKEYQSLWNRGFIECVILQLLGYLSFGMTMPVLPMYVVELSGSAALAGAITGVFALCALAMRPLSGFIADIVNKKWLQCAGLVVGAIGLIGYGLSNSEWSLFVFRVIHSVGFCFETTVTIAITLTMVPKGREGESIGYFSLTQVVSSALAPFVGVWIAKAFGCQMTFQLSAALLLCGAVISLFIPYDFKPERRSSYGWRDFVSTRSLPFALVAAMFAICSGVSQSFIVLLGDSRGIAGSALFFTVSAVGMALSRPVAGKTIDKRGTKPIVYPALIFEALTMILIASAQSIAAIVVAGVTRSVGQGMAQPALQTQIMTNEGRQRSGVASSTFNLGLDLGQGVGVILGGCVADAFGYGATFAAGPAVLAVAAVAYAVGMKKLDASPVRTQ